MKIETIAEPSHGLVFVHGPEGDEPPLPIWGANILVTNSCLSIGCRADVDGPTRFILGDIDSVDPRYEPEFIGAIRTPDGQIVISTVAGDTLQQASVAEPYCAISVWRNHPNWPDEVVVGVSAWSVERGPPTFMKGETSTQTSLRLPPEVGHLYISDRTPDLRIHEETFGSERALDTIDLSIAGLQARHLTILTEEASPGPDWILLADRPISNPEKRVIFAIRDGKVILDMHVKTTRTPIQAWFDRERAEIIISVML